MADIHLGAWREPKLRELNEQAFTQAITETITLKPDFVIIAGDLFNTAMPPIESIAIAVKKLRELKDNQIPVYLVAGSHDYTPAGKTLIDVLEHAGLCTNVFKANQTGEKLKLEFTTDEKTGAKLTGILGRRGTLEKEYYELLDRSIEQEKGFKIFVLHTTLTELKTTDLQEAESITLSLLPAGFDYYAAGHVHKFKISEIEGKRIVYPGPIFPNNIAELEKETGSYILYEDGKITRKELNIKPVKTITINCTNKTTEQIEQEIEKQESSEITILRLEGQAKMSDINLSKITQKLEEKGANCILKNTTKLQPKELIAIKVEQGTAEQIEQRIIQEKSKEKERELIHKLIEILSQEKGEQKTMDYEKRIIEQAEAVIGN